MFRAIGFYPTEKEVDDLLYEVRSGSAGQSGEQVEEIDFEEVVRCKNSLS